MNILFNAHPTTVFYRFMEGGGWTMLNMWLAEAKKTQNTPLLVELLIVSSISSACSSCLLTAHVVLAH